MFELNEKDINFVSAGNVLADSFATGGAIGAIGGAIYSGGQTATIVTATVRWGVLGATFGAAYGLTTMAGGGRLGSRIGQAFHTWMHS